MAARRSRVWTERATVTAFLNNIRRRKIEVPSGPIFALTVMSTSGHTFARRTHNARHDTSHHFDFDASWLFSSLATQSILGLWSLRRTGNRVDYCCNLGIDGTHLDCRREVKRII